MTLARDALVRHVCARLCDDRRTLDEVRVVDDVLSGLEHGAETIGPLDLSRDARDFDEEAGQECRDLLAYLAMVKVAQQHKRREAITATHDLMSRAADGEATGAYGKASSSVPPFACDDWPACDGACVRGSESP